MPKIEGVLFEFAFCTVTEKAGNAADIWPSLAEIRMSVWGPTSPSSGTPESVPAELSKLAHDGWFSMKNVTESPSGSDALGVNVQDLPTVALLLGLPEIDGGLFVVAGGGVV